MPTLQFKRWKNQSITIHAQQSISLQDGILTVDSQIHTPFLPGWLKKDPILSILILEIEGEDAYFIDDSFCTEHSLHILITQKHIPDIFDY